MSIAHTPPGFRNLLLYYGNGNGFISGVQGYLIHSRGILHVVALQEQFLLTSRKGKCTGVDKCAQRIVNVHHHVVVMR